MFPFIHHALIHYCLLLLGYRNGMYCRRRRLVDPTITLMKYEFPPLLLLPNETLNITAEVEGKQMDNLEKTSDPIDDGDLLKYENGSVQKFEYDFGRL